MTIRDSLGDRMRAFESHECDRKFMSGLPIYARIDGRGFSKFTKGMNRPYDVNMSKSMIDTTKVLVEETNANIGYVQSDEISLGWVLPTVDTGVWFDRKITKMTSVLAGLATAAFINSLRDNFMTSNLLVAKLPHFDARVMNLPNSTELANVFLWRNLDCTKNAVSMAASHYYSHKELMNKNGSEKQEMLFAKGVNFNDYPFFFKRGTFVKRIVVNRTLTEDERLKIHEKHRPGEFDEFTRSEIIEYSLPPLNKISNRIEVLFEGASPILNQDYP